MAGMKNSFSTVIGFVLVVGVVVLSLMYLQPSLFTRSEGFRDATLSAAANYSESAGQNAINGRVREDEVKGNPDE